MAAAAAGPAEASALQRRTPLLGGELSGKNREITWWARAKQKHVGRLHVQDASPIIQLDLPSKHASHFKYQVFHLGVLSIVGGHSIMKRAIDSVNEKIFAAIKRRAPDIVAADGRPPRLVAVSKLKPISSIIEAYECGQRYFGENYIQELETKSNSEELRAHCPEIKFHFIGHLQSNKVNKLLKVKNLHMIETIDSEKLADLIDKAIDRHKRENNEQLCFGDNLGNLQSDQLRVLIQVNTSGEEQKNGVQPSEVIKLADHIVGKCRWLRLAGLMTIGKLDGWNEPGPNKDFIRLYEVRDSLSKHLSIDPRDLELSMGMSSDFEQAIELGSTNVRVGTMIFGERTAPQK